MNYGIKVKRLLTANNVVDQAKYTMQNLITQDYMNQTDKTKLYKATMVISLLADANNLIKELTELEELEHGHKT